MALRSQCLLLTCLFAAASVSAETPDCAEAATARVQARYDGVRDLRADFTQKSSSIALGNTGLAAEETTGKVQFQKPGKMRWQYESPQPSLVVSDGDKLWIHDPEAGEAQVLDVDAGFLSGAAVQFLLGEGRIAENFEVEALSCDEREAFLRLRPRKDATYELIEARVERETGWVTETTVQDLFGNRTTIAFRGLEANTEPAADLFRFVPPEGTRVLELGGAAP